MSERVAKLIGTVLALLIMAAIAAALYVALFTDYTWPWQNDHGTPPCERYDNCDEDRYPGP